MLQLPKVVFWAGGEGRSSARGEEWERRIVCKGGKQQLGEEEWECGASLT